MIKFNKKGFIMRKGNEILTIAELNNSLDENICFYANNELIKNREISRYIIDVKNKYYHALPDYKTLDQRVFDGMDKKYTEARVSTSGLCELYGDNCYFTIGNGYEPNQTIKRDFTLDGYTLDEAKQFLKDGELQYYTPLIGWVDSCMKINQSNFSNYRRKPQVKTFQNTPIGRTFFDDIEINGVSKKIELMVAESDSCNGCYYKIKDCCPEENACFKDKHISGKSVKAVRVEKKVTKRDILERIIEHENCDGISCHRHKYQYNAGVPCPLLSYNCSVINKKSIAKKLLSENNHYNINYDNINEAV